jgi:hypothetical protein
MFAMLRLSLSVHHTIYSDCNQNRPGCPFRKASKEDGQQRRYDNQVGLVHDGRRVPKHTHQTTDRKVPHQEAERKRIERDIDTGDQEAARNNMSSSTTSSAAAGGDG